MPAQNACRAAAAAVTTSGAAADPAPAVRGCVRRCQGRQARVAVTAWAPQGRGWRLSAGRNPHAALRRSFIPCQLAGAPTHTCGDPATGASVLGALRLRPSEGAPALPVSARPHAIGSQDGRRRLITPRLTASPAWQAAAAPAATRRRQVALLAPVTLAARRYLQAHAPGSSLMKRAAVVDDQQAALSPPGLSLAKRRSRSVRLPSSAPLAPAPAGTSG